MFVIYGSRSEEIDFGPRETRRCTGCDKPTSYHLILAYRFYHIFYELGAVVEKQHFLRCRLCGLALPEPEPTELSTSRRIPFQRRFGLYAWFVFVLIVTIPLLKEEYSKF